MSRYWQVFRALALAKPYFFGVLLLFYLCAGWVALAADSEAASFLVLILCVFPTVALFALFSERMGQLCASAGQLGVPRHVGSVRAVQLALIAMFVGGSLLLGMIAGGNVLLLAAVLSACAAGGTLVVTADRIGVGLAAIPLAIGVFAGTWAWFLNPYVQAGLLLLSAFVLLRWLGTPALLQECASHHPALLADSSHELSDAVVGAAFAPGLERDVAASKRHLARGSFSDVTLGLGLGFSLRPSLRSVLPTVSVYIVVVLVAWQFYSTQVRGVYLFAVSLAAFVTFFRGNEIIAAWRRSVEEQGLLALSPGWPHETSVKRAFLQAIAWTLVAPWATYAAVSIATLALGIISREIALVGAVALLAGSCAGVTWSCLLLSRRWVKEWHVAPILTVVCAVIGTVYFAFSEVDTTRRWTVPLLLILGPTAAALAWFTARPLQFPVNIRR